MEHAFRISSELGKIYVILWLEQQWEPNNY